MVNKQEIIDIYEDVLTRTNRFPNHFYKRNPDELKLIRVIILEYLLKQKLGFNRGEAISNLNIQFARKYRIYNFEKRISGHFNAVKIINDIYPTTMQWEWNNKNDIVYAELYNENKQKIKDLIKKEGLTKDFIFNNMGYDYLESKGIVLYCTPLSDIILDLYPTITPWEMKNKKKNFYNKEMILRYLDYVIGEIVEETGRTKQEVAKTITVKEIEKYVRIYEVARRLKLNIRELLMEKYKIDILDIRKENFFWKDKNNFKKVLQSISNRYNIPIKYITSPILLKYMGNSTMNKYGGACKIREEYSYIKPKVNLK